MSEKPTIPNGDEHVHTVDEDELQSGAARGPLDEQKVKTALVQKRIQGMSTPKKIVWLVVILLLIGGAGYGYYRWTGNQAKPTYSTATVIKGTVTKSIEATGTLKAVRESDMGFKNNAQITAINVKPGDHVTAGEILAQQDATDLQATVQQAQNSVNQDAIGVKSANVTLATNQKTLNQDQQLFAAGAISQNDLDAAQNSYTTSQLNLETAQSKLASDQSKLTQAQTNLSAATLAAPFDGIIGVVNGQVGQLNGINTSTSILLSVLSDQLQLNAEINEADIGNIKVGQDVEFTTATFGSRIFTGQVIQITPQATTVSNVQYYPVLISVNDPDKVLMTGMSVDANVIVTRVNNTLTMPMLAVSYAKTYLKSNPSQAPSGNGPVVVVLQNGQPVVKSVTLGVNDGSNYVVSQGVNAGDKVIVGASQTTGSSPSGSGSGSSSSSSNRVRGLGGPGGF